MLVLPQRKPRDMRFRQQISYEPDGLGDDTEAFNAERARAEVAIARWVGEFLERHFSGQAWHVVTRIGQRGRGGLISIRLNGIMPANYWRHVQLSETLNDPSGHVIMRAAGELLERYKLPRSNFKLDHWRNAMDAMPLFARQTGRGHVAPLLD